MISLFAYIDLILVLLYNIVIIIESDAAMNPISATDRQHIVRLRGEGKTVKETSQTLKIPASTISRIYNNYLKTGEIRPKKYRACRKAGLTDEQMIRTEMTLKARPDATLQEIKDTLKLEISTTAPSNFIRKRLRWERKKKRLFQAAAKLKESRQTERLMLKNAAKSIQQTL